MKKIFSYFMVCIGCFMLCGCSEYPAMQEADTDLVAEYAAGLLLKHSEASESRLMDVEEAKLLLEAEKQKEEQEEIVEIPEEPETEPEEVPEEIIEPDETPVIDNTEPNEEVPSAPIGDAMGVEMLSVQLNGYEIKDSYPDGSGSFFALDAGEGNKLLVAKITLINNTDNSVDINMLEKSISYKMSLDGNGYKFVLSTMLLDDLSTYVGTIGAGSSTELVLISEWSEELLNNMSNPMLHIKNDELVGKYPLQ